LDAVLAVEVDVRRHHGTQAASFSSHASGESLMPEVP
jgi:hypothetical protein